MKHFYITLLLLLSVSFISAQNQAFITSWEVDNVNGLNITIPTEGTGYDYTVDFGDGTILNNQTGDATHTYNTAGIYTVSITGDFPRIYFISNYGSGQKLASIEQWGDIQWQSMEDAFYSCGSLMVNAIDAPDLSQVINLSGMFAGCDFNQSINHWDVSNVTNMERMFGGATLFNQPLGNWDVSNVTNMQFMFAEAFDFNQSLNNWNVSNVINMNGMFEGAFSFNQSLDNWHLNINVDLDGFLSYSGLDINNYDNFLTSLISQQNLQGLTMGVSTLEYCNILARYELVNNKGWIIDGDFLANNCNHDKIIGDVIYDMNNNGCNNGTENFPVENFLIIADNGMNTFSTFPNSTGNYSLPIIGTSFSVSLNNLPSYFNSSPITGNVTFTNSDTETLDFCLTSNQNVEDLNITLLPINQARPGFSAIYQLIVENMGTQTIANAMVTLDFDNTMQSFVNASVTPISTTANQMTFGIGNIQPLTSQTIDITMQTFQPPTVNGDDVLSFTANVSPSTNDFTPNDNTFTYNQTVVNSYDPNDKQVLQGEEIKIGEVDEYLNYLIRFQNTGTASAVNVRLLDILHPKLDWSTLKPVNASHDYRVQITNGNQVEFIFDDINLLDENTNEPASHGFVAYKIKPKNDVVVGDFITGDASIYFDFNAPIITNTVSTEVINNLKVNNNTIENNISVYPNPVNDLLYIETKNGVEVQELSVYNIQGKQILFRKENLEKLDLEDLSSGMYLLSIKTTQGTLNQQLIKK